MICHRCKFNDHDRCITSGSQCTCQHKADRPWTAKYDLPDPATVEVQTVTGDG